MRITRLRQNHIAKAAAKQIEIVGAVGANGDVAVQSEQGKPAVGERVFLVRTKSRHFRVTFFGFLR
jgi:hypothetical protein